MSIIDRALAHRRYGRALRLLISSGIATAADGAVLFALAWGRGMPPALATVVGCVVGGAFNFALTRGWVFRARERRWLAQAVRYFAIVVGGGALVSGAAVAALTALSLPLAVAKIGAVIVTMASWTYPMSARVVFAATPAAPARPLSRRGLAT